MVMILSSLATSAKCRGRKLDFKSPQPVMWAIQYNQSFWVFLSDVGFVALVFGDEFLNRVAPIMNPRLKSGSLAGKSGIEDSFSLPVLRPVLFGSVSKRPRCCWPWLHLSVVSAISVSSSFPSVSTMSQKSSLKQYR